MAKVKSFRDLIVWQRAMELAGECYRLTAKFPESERFGLTAQIRKASVSIVSNIPEGYRRRSRAAYLAHLDIALGSQGEVDAQLELAVRLQFCSGDDARKANDLADEAGRMLAALIDSLQP